MKPLKLKITDSSNVFFSSDWHLNHTGKGMTPLWEARGYISADRMTEHIIEKINATVRPTDYIFYTGDLCLDTSAEQFEQNIEAINCRNIFLLWGNHNSQVKQAYRRTITEKFNIQQLDDTTSVENTDEFNVDRRGYIEVYPIRYKNLIFCGHYMEVTVNRQLVCLCHYPIECFNNMQHGAWMVCGHSHYTFNKTRADCTDSKRLDVSWEGHKKPVSFTELCEIMKHKHISEIDHHNSETT